MFVILLYFNIFIYVILLSSLAFSFYLGPLKISLFVNGRVRMAK